MRVRSLANPRRAHATGEPPDGEPCRRNDFTVPPFHSGQEPVAESLPVSMLVALVMAAGPKLSHDTLAAPCQTGPVGGCYNSARWDSDIRRSRRTAKEQRMTTETFDAIFEHGSFHLIGGPSHIPLRDGQRVRLVIETDESPDVISGFCGQRLCRVVSARRDGGGTHCIRPLNPPYVTAISPAIRVDARRNRLRDLRLIIAPPPIRPYVRANQD